MAATVTRTETSQADWLTGTLDRVNALRVPNSLTAALAPTWDVLYEANALPTAATPAWTKTSAATNSEAVGSGELHTSCSGAGGYLYYDRSGIVTAGNITVVEAKLRVVSHAGDANWLAIWDGTNRVTLYLDTNALRAWDGSYHSYSADLTVNHVVRLIKYGTAGWVVYLDGVLVLSGAAFAATATNWISFGHPNAGSAGEVYWDYIYYATAAPITRYEADVLPVSAVPAWPKYGSGTEEILSNELHLVNTYPNALFYERSGIVTAANVTVAEYRMRVVSHGAVTPITSAIDDGTRGIQIGFWTDKLRITDTSDHDYAVDMTVTRVMRLVKTGSTGWELFVDGASVLKGSAFYATGLNRFWFGHGSGSYGGESYWDYIYYSLSGDLTYGTQGLRTWPSLDLSGVVTAASSIISWNKTTPANTIVTVETSLNGGSSWSTATSGSAIPGISEGTSLTGISLLVRITLETTDSGSTPEVADLTATIEPLVALTESGSGVDALTAPTVIFTASDTGSGVEALIAPTVIFTVSDAGSGVDVLAALLASFLLSDTGAGSDSYEVGLLLLDSGTGTDSLVSPVVTFTAVDSGTGSELISVLSSVLALADTGVGIDAAIIAAVLTVLSDVGVGVDAAPVVAVAFTLSDSGVLGIEFPRVRNWVSKVSAPLDAEDSIDSEVPSI